MSGRLGSVDFLQVIDIKMMIIESQKMPMRVKKPLATLRRSD
jgi:hypothetical protein